MREIYHIMKKLLLLFFCLASLGYAQVNDNYIPLSSDENAKALTVTAIDSKYEFDIESLPKENRSDYKKIFKYRRDELVSDLDSDKFIFGTELNALLQKVFDRISINNSKIPSNGIRLLLSRNTEANAYCMGEGTIIINIGLLRFLENESQLAFVMCHELAHYRLNHVNNSINDYVIAINDKKNRKAIKRLANEEYYSNSKALEFLKEITYNGLRYSQRKELQADSLGMVFFKNSIFMEQEVLACLEILNKVDKEKYPDNFDFKKILATKDYPFQKSWLEEEVSGLGLFKNTQKEILNDSLKTHPGCEQRIALIKKNFTITQKQNKLLMSRDEFLKLNLIADFEVVRNEYLNNNYARCFYHIIGLLHQYPENAYLNTMLIRCLHQIYEAQSNHTLSKYIDREESIADNNYKQALLFIKNIKPKELANLCYYYLNDRKERLQTNEDFIYASYVSSKMLGNGTDQEKWKETYLKKFPEGKFAKYLL